MFEHRLDIVLDHLALSLKPVFHCRRVFELDIRKGALSSGLLWLFFATGRGATVRLVIYELNAGDASSSWAKVVADLLFGHGQRLLELRNVQRKGIACLSGPRPTGRLAPVSA